MKKSGFNLIELLSVMGVLALAGTLTFPAWRDALAASRRAACASNLRQMATAYLGYMLDHDGALFPYMTQDGSDRVWFWGRETGGAAEGQRVIDRTQARLAPYLGVATVETCREFPYRATFYKQKFATATYGYGLNHYLLRGLPANRSAGISAFDSITQPSQTILWGDAAQINTWQAPASPRNPMLEEWYYLSHLEPTYHFRHGRRVQVAMADGGVRLLEPHRLLPQCDGQVGHLEPPGRNDYLRPVK